MKTLQEKILLFVLLIFVSSTAFAQFDDLYYTDSDDDYDRTYEEYDEHDIDEAYAYEDSDDDSYDYFDDFNSNDEYYDGYQYTRRINRFNRGYRNSNYYSTIYTSPVFIDRGFSSNFWFDPLYTRSFRNAYLNPFVYNNGLSININIGNRLRRVSQADLYYLYTSGAITYGDYRRATTRGTFGRGFNGYNNGGIYGGVNRGFYGGGFNRFGGGGGAYYCPPISGLSRAVRPNAINNVASARNTQVTRTEISSSRNRTRINPTQRTSTNRGTVANARGTNTTRTISSNGRSREYSTSRERVNTRKNVSKANTSSRDRNSSITNSRRNNTSSIRRTNTSTSRSRITNSRPSRSINNSRRSNNSRSTISRSSGSRSSSISRSSGSSSRGTSSRGSSSSSRGKR